jgi:hypothetical protein
MLRDKEQQLKSASETVEQAIKLMKHDYEKKISDLKGQFKQDFMKYD